MSDPNLPPQQPQSPPQTWGQQPAMPYMPAQTQANPYDDECTVVLVTGILSLVLCGFIGIFAWLRGNSIRDRAQAAGWPEPTMGKVGRILGIVGTVMGLVQIGFVVIWMIAVVGFAATGA